MLGGTPPLRSGSVAGGLGASNLTPAQAWAAMSAGSIVGASPFAAGNRSQRGVGQAASRCGVCAYVCVLVLGVVARVQGVNVFPLWKRFFYVRDMPLMRKRAGVRVGVR